MVEVNCWFKLSARAVVLVIPSITSLDLGSIHIQLTDLILAILVLSVLVASLQTQAEYVHGLEAMKGYIHPEGTPPQSKRPSVHNNHGITILQPASDGMKHYGLLLSCCPIQVRSTLCVSFASGLLLFTTHNIKSRPYSPHQTYSNLFRYRLCSMKMLPF